jgi:hypothetical protein
LSHLSVEIIVLITHPIICHAVSEMLDSNCTDTCGNTTSRVRKQNVAGYAKGSSIDALATRIFGPNQ